MKPPVAVGVGQESLWVIQTRDDGATLRQVVGFCCVNPDHSDTPCAANNHGAWTDMAAMLRWAAACIQPGCQVAFITAAQGGGEHA